MANKALLTTARRHMYEIDAKTIQWYRSNPLIAVEDLIGAYLSDAQSWVFSNLWLCVWGAVAASRNLGKSYLIVLYSLLRALLYENQNIYIISSVGDQAKETFMRLEQLVTRSGIVATTSPDLKDIAEHEVVVNAKNNSGFIHSPNGYKVELYNGSIIHTLNSKPDNARGKRATLLVYDEAAFVADELIIATEPFTSQDSDAQYGKDTAKTQDILAIQPENQTFYMSSVDSVDTLFYKRYREYAKQMLIGNRDYFCADLPCGCAITMYHKGEKIPPLLKQEVVDAALRSNKDKALREYYNVPDANSSDKQIVKWATIRNSERQIVPYQECRGNKIVLAFDPARTMDNSILGAMELVDDPEYGMCGNIIGCTNFVDIASKKKYKLDSNRQISELRDIIADYNGKNPDYEYIDSLLIDQGSGGGGTSTYADNLLNNWTDNTGKIHKGFIDAEHELYQGYCSRYPDAIDKLRLISPRKYRTQMVEEFIELMELGVIRFPYAYNGQEFFTLNKGVDKSGEELLETYMLSIDEMQHLKQIDLMKTEIANIHKTTNAEHTSVQYALSKEKQNTMHDDRAYVLWLLAHRLYELRRGTTIRQRKSSQDISSAFMIRAPKIL